MKVMTVYVLKTGSMSEKEVRITDLDKKSSSHWKKSQALFQNFVNSLTKQYFEGIIVMQRLFQKADSNITNIPLAKI